MSNAKFILNTKMIPSGKNHMIKDEALVEEIIMEIDKEKI